MKPKSLPLALALVLGLALSGAPALADDTKPADNGNAQASGDGNSGGGDQAKDDPSASDIASDVAAKCGEAMMAVGIVSMMKDCQNKNGN